MPMKHWDAPFLLQRKKSLKRELLGNESLIDRRIAILGGSTTAEVRDMLELFLLHGGIRPSFYESEFGRFYEDVQFDEPRLREFEPDLVYLHTLDPGR